MQQGVQAKKWFDLLLNEASLPFSEQSGVKIDWINPVRNEYTLAK